MSVMSYRPKTLDEALSLLDSGKPLTIFAGGTDLMIRKRQWQGAARRFDTDVMFIAHLEALKQIKVNPEDIEIGACVTQQALLEHSEIPDYFKKVLGDMATPAIRQAATLGGNVVNAASVADTLPVLIAVDALVVLESESGIRMVPVSEFVKGKYETALKPGELLVSIRIPRLNVTHFEYKKLGNRKASILAKLSVLVLWEGTKVRIAIGAVNDTVIRDKALELDYQSTEDLEALIDGFKSKMQGQDDKRSTKYYKETVACNLLRQFLEGKS